MSLPRKVEAVEVEAAVVEAVEVAVQIVLAWVLVL
jgi:hypothetical protein